MSVSLKELRKEFEQDICEFMDAVEKTGNNSAKFMSDTAKMSDEEFFDHMKTMFEGDKSHFYLEYNVMDNEPDFEDVLAASELVGYQAYDYIVTPSEDDDGQPFISLKPALIGVAPQRVVQQFGMKKNNVPLDVSKRNPLTDQVTGASKGGRVSDNELFALITQGVDPLVQEYHQLRSSNAKGRNQLSEEIATKGTATLGDKEVSRFDNAALMLADMALKAAGIESDMVLKGNLLPRTVLQAGETGKVKGLKRKEGATGEER